MSGQLSSASPGALLCGEWAVVFGESRGIAVCRDLNCMSLPCTDYIFAFGELSMHISQ